MEDFSLAELIGVVRKNWLLIAAISLPITVLACAYGFFMAPTVWEAQTSIVFEEKTSDMLSLLGSATSFVPSVSGGRGDFLEVILKSRSVRGRVVDSLDLVDEFGATSREQAIEQLGEMYRVKLPVSRVLVLQTTWKGEPKFRVRTDPGNAPDMAAELARALILSLEEEVSQTGYTEAAQKRKLLQELLDRATTELTAAENELVKFATSERMVNPSAQEAAAVNELRTLLHNENELQSQLDGAIARQVAAEGDLSDQERLTVERLSETRDPAIDRLREKIMNLEQQITEQVEVQGKSENHPDVASLISEQESAREQLSELLQEGMRVEGQTLSVDPAYSKLVDEALTNRQRVSELRASIAVIRDCKQQIRDELLQYPAKSSTYLRLRRQVDMKAEAVERLTESYEVARIGEATSATTFAVIDEAVPPSKPSAPSLRKTGAVSLAASLMFAILVAFWRQGSTKRSNGRAEAEETEAGRPST